VLASRIDELPSRLLALPGGDRPRGAAVELGKLVLLARAFRATPTDPEIRRAVATSETRETVLNDPQALRVQGLWEVLAERVETRRDGLVSQTVWLLHIASNPANEGPRFAMLLDFFPASAGKRGSGFASGERFSGELAFYPGRNPLRAFLLHREAIADESDWPEPQGTLAEALTVPLLVEPWALDRPLLLPAGRLASDAAGHSWWRSQDGNMALPLTRKAEGLIRGAELTRAVALWSGAQLEILAAQTPWGRILGAD